MARKNQLPLKCNSEPVLSKNIWTALTLRFVDRIAIRDSDSGLAGRQLETTDSIIPLSTVTVFESTIFQTTFVTLYASESADPLATTSRVRNTPAIVTLATSSSMSRIGSSSTITAKLLPPVVVGSSTISEGVPTVMTTGSGMPVPTVNTSSAKDPAQRSNRTAIVGGLSGTIAGLLFIGVIVCLMLRRRRKKEMSEQASERHCAARDDALLPDASEKGFATSFIHPRSATAMTRESPASAFQGLPGAAPAVDEDHRMIRMSTCHWPRPFAPGAGEGYRESVPTGKLRCTNPDRSRPGTPQSISSNPKQFFGRPRTLFRGSSRSHLHQKHPLSQGMPTIKLVNPAFSRERPSRYSNTPSFKSYPSMSTVQVVHHRTPDDPFLTPSAEEIVGYGQLQRPNVQRTTSAWSQISSLLDHLRNRSASNLESGLRASSRYSVDTISSARFSRRSDPFDLDRHSRGWTVGSEGQTGSYLGRRSQILYEGT